MIIKIVEIIQIMIIKIVADDQTLLPPLALLLPPSQGNDLKLSHLKDLHADDADVCDADVYD